MRHTTVIILAALCAHAARADRLIGTAVMVAQDGSTIPSNSVATPAQVEQLSGDAGDAKTLALAAQDAASDASGRVAQYSTNYVVTSTVYVQSIGGVPYDPSNQTVRICSVTPAADSVEIVAAVRQTPLVAPVLDWRMALNGGAWSNVTATVSETAVPDGVTNAVKAYRFTLARPAVSNAFFRVVDNSTGASGSGLWWLVFGGITVDGHRGWSGTITNVVDHATNLFPVVGGIFVEPEPMGGF